MSASVRPASATAARHASTASDSGSTISRRPIAERPTPESTTRCSKRSLLRGRPHGRALRLRDPLRAVGRCRSARTAAARRPRAARSARVTSWPMWTSSGSQPTMFVVSRTAASSASATIAIAYGGSNDGQPLVAVDREPDDGAAPRHDGRRPRPAAARRADRRRRVDERLAVAARLDPELAVGAGGPEPLVHRRELGKRSHRLLLRCRYRWSGSSVCGRHALQADEALGRDPVGRGSPSCAWLTPTCARLSWPGRTWRSGSPRGTTR